MIIFYWIMEVIACGMDGLLYIYAYQLFSRDKLKCGWKEVCFIAMIAIIGIIGCAFEDWGNIFSTLITYFLLLVYGRLYNETNNKMVILNITILYLSIGIFSTLFINFLNIITKIPIEELTECASGNIRLYTILILKITCFFAVTIVLQFDKNENQKLHITERNQLLFEYVSMMVIILVIMYLMVNETLQLSSQILLSIVCLGIFIIFVETCILLQRLSTMYKEHAEYEAIMYMVQVEQKNIEERKYEYERIKMLNHDMKHYLSTAIGMLGKDGADAKEYLESLLREKIALNTVGVCIGNSILEAVINTKAEVMKDKGIILEAFLAEDINYGKGANLSIMLANLLDNAIEACEYCEEKNRLIRIQSRLQKGYIHFQIQNTVCGDVLETNPMLNTTKEDKELHGLGIRSVRSMLEEEHGFLNQYQSGNLFISDLYVPIMPKNDQLCQRG